MNRILQKKSFKESIVKAILDGALPIVASKILSPEEMSALIKTQANFKGALLNYIKTFPQIERLDTLITDYMNERNVQENRSDIASIFISTGLLSEFPAFQIVYLEGISRFNLLLCACLLKSYDEETVIKTPPFAEARNFCHAEGLPVVIDEVVDSQLLDMSNRKKVLTCGQDRDLLRQELCDRLIEKYQAHIRVKELFEFIGQYALGKYA